ncbi:MAG: hypothetical protein IJU72_10420 [Bacteroidales bacterium]|nr:hypothetical protein [Bacteroidales bacterium]
MEPDEIIQSDALAANLSQTRVDEVLIPDEQQWFLSLSERYLGIHERTREFLRELHHPMSNRTEVVQALLKISISDFWVIKEVPERHRAVGVVLDIYAALLREALPDALAHQLVATYLDFIWHNYDTLAEHSELLLKYIGILDDCMAPNEFAYIGNMGGFRKKFDRLLCNPQTQEAAFLFMRRLIVCNIDFWGRTTQLERWLDDNRTSLTHAYPELAEQLGSQMFASYREQAERATAWPDLRQVAFTFSEIIDAMRAQTASFSTITDQLCYIFYLMHLPGVAHHRDAILLDLNKTIKRISELDGPECVHAMDDLFGLFADFKQSHPNLILDSIMVLGREIIGTQRPELIRALENHIIGFGFATPGIAYLTNDWELKVDPNHIKNIRVWLELIECDPERMSRLLAALIINLRVGGIFIFDTDFFQKDITKLLNSRIQPIYKHIKQLSRIFPVFFSEIGAEGQLRDVSTKLDELSHRNDKLIHFLRKQIHTEGNSSHIDITSRVFHFWHDLDLQQLEAIVPQNVFATIEVDGPWVHGVHGVLVALTRSNGLGVDELLELDKPSLTSMLGRIGPASSTDIARVGLMVELYQLLKEKYRFETNDIASAMRKYHFVDDADVELLSQALDAGQKEAALRIIFDIMRKLNAIIFDPQRSEGWENIFYKRHIAVGIPSMYGYYREPKFEALGLTFRLERIAALLVDDIIASINTEYFTAKTFRDLHGLLQLLREGLLLDGIADPSLDSNLKMLEYSLSSGSFTIGQYINIFHFMEGSIKGIISKYFINPYGALLEQILPQHIDPAMPKKRQKQAMAVKTEVFYRELLASAFIVQPLDNLMGCILNNLRKQVELLSDEEIQKIMTYNPELVISPLYQQTPGMDNQVFLGAKAYYLKDLHSKQYPIPPGFVITTEVFRRVEPILKVPALNAEIDSLIAHHLHQLEERSGLRYGDPDRPLLLSVRSGAAISMPGAMNTFLNVGLNDEITEHLSHRDNFGWTSWDCYRRLLQTWGMSHGLERDLFDQIILHYKQRHGVSTKIDFSPAMMREIAMAYKQVLARHNVRFEEEPMAQLKQAIIAVFGSWDTPRAQVYREHMQIAHEWGTAVIVQQMIFGNLHRESGSGVLFTRDAQDHSSQKINLTGDFSFLSQGEDIVAGLINTLPISEAQRLKYYAKSPCSLESAFPQIYQRLHEIARELIEQHGYGHQEVEFTFETSSPSDLYILQIRNMPIKRQQHVEVFAIAPRNMERAGVGVGIGGRALNGLVVFDLDDAARLQREQPEANAVLVRPDTVPDDIEMIFECQGLLTAKGGATSHAAVTAASLGKVCIVNCDDMEVHERDKRCVINGHTFGLFDPIALDGINGVVYKGNYPIKKQEV